MLHINRPMLDYLRLTHYSYQSLDQWDRLFAWVDEIPEPAKMLQYRGLRAGGLFYGDAKQRGRRHHMLDISGPLAHDLLNNAHVEGARCTRIDLQVTLDMIPGFEMRRLFDGLQDADWSGRRRKTSIVQSGDGYDTCYIGSRQSERFIRIYVKPTGEGIPTIRFEIEYKGQPARGVYDYAADRITNIAGFIRSEVDALPELEFGLSDAIRRVTGPEGKRPAVTTRESTNSGYRWLVRQVAPAVNRLMRDHEVGGQVRRLILQWADEARAIEHGKH